jgi:hypothetical protein
MISFTLLIVRSSNMIERDSVVSSKRRSGVEARATLIVYIIFIAKNPNPDLKTDFYSKIKTLT